MITTIQLDSDVKQKLDLLKVHKRESYNDLLVRLIDGSIISDVDKESLIDTIEIMSDPQTMRELAEANERINNGNYGTPLDDVKKELGIDV